MLPLHSHVRAPADADAGEVAGTREEAVAKFVKANSHDPLRSQECLLNSVAVMHVNIHVQHPARMGLYIRSCW